MSCAVVFIAGSGLYKKSPPQGNILLQVCNCIGVSHLPGLPGYIRGFMSMNRSIRLYFTQRIIQTRWLLFLSKAADFSIFIPFTYDSQFAIKNRWRRSEHEAERKHWLDWAEEKYSVMMGLLLFVLPCCLTRLHFSNIQKSVIILHQ